MKNTKIVLSKRPIGYPTVDYFKIIKSDQNSLKEDQIRIKTLFLSLDPYMRGRMRSLELGETMVGELIGKVIESKSAKLPEGSIVLTKVGWQSNPTVNESNASLVDPRINPLSLALGSIGMPGLTAYFGLLKIGKPKRGETVVVSAGSGAVGSVVGQIAKYIGCKVIGIAGSDEKVDYMIGKLKFDQGLNYKKKDWMDDLKEACSEGVDVYFDNVGGVITDTVIDEINDGARVLICGQISQYNNSDAQLGPRNLGQFLSKSAKLQGFMVYTFQKQFPEGIDFLLKMKDEGRLNYRETVVEGIENAPKAFLKLFSGENFGKLLIKVN